jgi:hypothetical protein
VCRTVYVVQAVLYEALPHMHTPYTRLLRDLRSVESLVIIYVYAILIS